jgi:WD40 repeat protein
MNRYGWATALLALLAPAGTGHAQVLKPRATLAGHGEDVKCLAFSPDGKALASASRGYDREQALRNPRDFVWGEVKVWDVATGKERLGFRGHKDGIEAIAFSPDGRTLATGSSDGSVRLWEAGTGEEVASFEHLDQIRNLAFSPDGKTLAAASPGAAWLWDVAGRKELRSFKRPVQGYNPAFSPDGKTLAASCHQDMDLWDLTTGKERLTLADHRGYAACAAFSPDGKAVAVASNRDEGYGKLVAEVKVWEAATGKERATFRVQLGGVSGVLFSPDGKALALLGVKGLYSTSEVKMIDAATGRALATPTFKEDKKRPMCMAFGPDGQVFAVGCLDGTVQLWDFDPAKEK